MKTHRPAPQFTALKSAIQQEAFRRTKVRKRRNASLELREYMHHKMDLNRFAATYAIGEVLAHKTAMDLMDDFVLVANAERFTNRQDKTPLALFITAAQVLIEQINRHRAMTLQDAVLLHRASDAARQYLPHYSDPAVEFACLKLNEIYLARNDGSGFAPCNNTPAFLHQPPNILQLQHD